MNIGTQRWSGCLQHSNCNQDGILADCNFFFIIIIFFKFNKDEKSFFLSKVTYDVRKKSFVWLFFFILPHNFKNIYVFYYEENKCN